MKRKTILRLMSCCLAGILLVEAPIQVDAASLGSSSEPVVSADVDEEEPGEAVLNEDTDEKVEVQQKPEEDKPGDTLEEAGPDQGTESVQENNVVDPVKTETAKKEEDTEENIPDSVPTGEGEQNSETQETTTVPVEEPDAILDEEPEELPDEMVTDDSETAYLTLTGLRYGSLPEYSDDFDADAADTILAELSEAFMSEEADISKYAMSPETLADVLTWLADHEEAYDTLLPYVEYTYIEKEDIPEVQTVTLSRIPEEELLSLSAVRGTEDVRISFVSVDGIEQYRLFRIAADEITEISMEEGQELFIDRIAFEEQSDCKYVLCGYQTVEEELKLCAFSRYVDGEYELLPPENLKAVPGEESVTVKWDETPMASGYEIEVSVEENEEFVSIGQTKETEYIQNGLEAGETYYYRVRAYSENDGLQLYSDYTDEESAVVLFSEPFPLEYTIKGATATLKWSHVDGADKYIIYKIEKDGTKKQIGEKEDAVASSHTFPINNLKYNDVFRYQVIAYKGDAGLASSKEIEIKVTFTPITLNGSVSGIDQIKLTWTSSDWAEGYIIQRKASSNDEWEELGRVSESETAFPDETVKLGIKYSYRVIPYRGTGGTSEGEPSNTVTKETSLAAGKISSVTATDYKTLKITWGKVSNATGYELYRLTSKDDIEGTKIASGNITSYTDTGRVPGVTYYYMVRSYYKGAASDNKMFYGKDSNVVGKATSIGKVGSVKAVSASYNSIKLTWGKVTGATGYVIERSEDGSTYKTLKTITSGSTLTYTNSSLTFNKKYYYRIRAYYKKSDGNNTYGSYSSVVSATTKLPTSKISSVTSVNYNTVKITWAKVTGATGYKVYRSTSASGTYSAVATIKSGSTVTYQNTGLTMDKTYYYKVRPYRTVSGKEVYGDYSAAVKGTPKLGAVTGAKAVSASYNAVKVSWAKTTGASGYVVYYSTSKDSGYKTLKTVTSTSVTHSGLTTGKTYYYKVRAYRTVSGKKVYGGYCSVVSAKPVPGTVAAKRSTLTYNSVKMTWAKISGANGYEIYRSGSKDGTYSKIKTITSGSTLSYTNTSLVTGKTYYYKIRAYRTVNGKKVYGSFSAVISGKPNLKTPTLKKSTVTYNSAKLTWNKIDGANGYEIYRSTSKNGTYTKIKSFTSGSTVSYTNTGLTTGKTYYYKVRAYRTVSGKKVYGAFSELVNAKPVLSKVTGLKAAPTGDDKSGSIKVNWSKVNGATGYKIMRSTSKNGTYKTIKTITSGSTMSYTNTGLAFGQTYYYKIYATRNDYTSSAAGPVSAMAIAMNLSDETLSLTVGNSQKVAAATVPKVTVSWSTSDKKIATVDSNGKVTAVGAGTAKIYAKANGLTRSISVTVKGKNAGAYKGIDVSSYQGSIDWKKVKKDGIDFAMIRVITGSSSSTTRDTMFKENYDGARDNGIKVGLYRYSYATSRTKARKEAQAIIDTLHGRKLDYPIVMDMEDSSILSGTDSNARRSEIILAFKEVIEDAGYDFALYANTTWLNKYLDMNMLKDVDIWVARWRSLDQGHGYNGKGKVTMWQYSSEGKVNGISGKVDLNVSYKNY